MPRVVLGVTFRPPQSHFACADGRFFSSHPIMRRQTASGERMSAPVRDDLKSTLNLPRTDFAMKANLPVNEPKMLARWDEMRLYDKIREARAGRPIYVLHHGPAYTNGLIHLGTPLDNCVKDLGVKP